MTSSPINYSLNLLEVHINPAAAPPWNDSWLLLSQIMQYFVLCHHLLFLFIVNICEWENDWLFILIDCKYIIVQKYFGLLNCWEGFTCYKFKLCRIFLYAFAFKCHKLEIVKNNHNSWFIAFNYFLNFCTIWCMRTERNNIFLLLIIIINLLVNNFSGTRSMLVVRQQ